MAAEELARALAGLRNALAGVRLPIDLPGSAAAETRARQAVAQLDDYILPRLARLEAPLLAVVGGSTGAGKSTLVNSVVGRVVSAPGVIRPTTRSPVLVHHPDDAEWFGTDRILPGLGRSTDRVADAKTLQLVAEPSLPRGLAILDAPDVDSVVAENRVLAAQLLAAADLWLFVTSAARYADAVPWDYLRAAAERQAMVAVVLDRVPPAAMAEVPTHLGQMMGQRGLGSSPLFAVPETEVDAAGLLPEAAVAPIRGWLGELAADAASRQVVVMQTLDGAIRSLVGHAAQIAQAVADQVAAIETLRQAAEQSYAEAVRTVSVQTADGSLLRGEVLERWHDFVGTGEFFRAVEQKIGWLRDRMLAAIKGEPKQAVEVSAAVESGMEVLVREQGEAAAGRTGSAWLAHPAGRQLVEASGEELTRASKDFDLAAKRLVRDWQADVMELVSEVGAAKKSRARFWALGVNGVGVALMVLVFSQTGGLLGAELGVAGGAAVLAQRVLEGIFGEDAVRQLAKQAKIQLDDRVQSLMAGELARFETALAAVDARPEQAGAIGDAIAEIEPLRARLAQPAIDRAARPELGPAVPTGQELAAEVLEGTVIEAEETR